MADIRIVDVRDEATFALLPPCADPSFDHRTCDYWEDGDRGVKTHRASWLSASRPAPESDRHAADAAFNPFAPPPRTGPAVNPFAFDEDDVGLADNPFVPRRPKPQRVEATAPRKLALLGRGLAIFGSYAKVLLLDDVSAAYAQFGPLSAYPRALRLRELYPRLPQTPLPAVITCVATTAAARGQALGQMLVAAVCDDLAARGFAAVEAYPEAGTRVDATSAATPAFWVAAGFTQVVADERFPVMRRELE